MSALKGLGIYHDEGSLFPPQKCHGQGRVFLIDEVFALKNYGIELVIIPRNPDREVFHSNARSLCPDALWLPLISVACSLEALWGFCNLYL